MKLHRIVGLLGLVTYFLGHLNTSCVLSILAFFAYWEMIPHLVFIIVKNTISRATMNVNKAQTHRPHEFPYFSVTFGQHWDKMLR